MSTDAKTRAAEVRHKAGTRCPWSDSPAKDSFIMGYLGGALETAYEREEQLESQLAAMTADRDAWKDLADCRKPNRTLQTT